MSTVRLRYVPDPACPDSWGQEPALGRLRRELGAARCDLPGPRAAAALWRLAEEWRARPEPRGTGELWHAV